MKLSLSMLLYMLTAAGLFFMSLKISGSFGGFQILFLIWLFGLGVLFAHSININRPSARVTLLAEVLLWLGILAIIGFFTIGLFANYF